MVVVAIAIVVVAIVVVVIIVIVIVVVPFTVVAVSSLLPLPRSLRCCCSRVVVVVVVVKTRAGKTGSVSEEVLVNGATQTNKQHALTSLDPTPAVVGSWCPFEHEKTACRMIQPRDKIRDNRCWTHLVSIPQMKICCSVLFTRVSCACACACFVFRVRVRADSAKPAGT